MSFIQKSIDFFKQKLVKDGWSKKVLATALAASFILGNFSINSYAVPITKRFRSGDVEIVMTNTEGPSIKHLLPGVSGSAKLNYGETSNTFRIITGQAIEDNPANRPPVPVDPRTPHLPATGSQPPHPAQNHLATLRP